MAPVKTEVKEESPSNSPKPSTSKLKKPAKAPAAKKTPANPTSVDMVIEAITNLAEKGGSSLNAIKKSIAETHKNVDMKKQSNNIKKALKKLTETGKLVQTKGKGANGSFKVAGKSKPVKSVGNIKVEPEAKESAAKMASAVKKALKPVAPKKTLKPIKAVATKKTLKPIESVAPKKTLKPIESAPKKAVTPKPALQSMKAGSKKCSKPMKSLADEKESASKTNGSAAKKTSAFEKTPIAQKAPAAPKKTSAAKKPPASKKAPGSKARAARNGRAPIVPKKCRRDSISEQSP